MSPDDFALALRVLDAPLFLDNRGTPASFGVEYTATTSDGKSVLVTQLSPTLNSCVTNPDAFVRTLGRYGYQGAGITESGQLYYLELPPHGVSLAQRLASKGPLPAADLTAVARATIDVLMRLELRGEAHGMVTPDAVHLLDSGAVSLRWPGLMPALRAAGVAPEVITEALGIAAFIAPEVQRGALPDIAGDVFALGTTLYAGLTGRPPFGGRTTATMMAAVLADDGAPVTTVSGTLTTVLLRAIEARPEDRWRNLQQFRDALDTNVIATATARGKLSARLGCVVLVAVIVAVGLVLGAVSHYIS
jgi:serine/threonine protein kinase